MRTFDLFIVKLDKQLDDKITTPGGLELFIDTKFNEFENRIQEGPVVAAPFKHDTGVEVGDTLYFHHLVVLNEGQILTGEPNHYTVRFDPEHTINNQAIAYKNQHTGDIRPLAGWSLLEPVEEKEVQESDTIELVKLSEVPVTKGRVAFEAPWINEIGAKAGDIVGFRKNMDYRVNIEGKEYYRTRAEDLLYVEV